MRSLNYSPTFNILHCKMQVNEMGIFFDCIIFVMRKESNFHEETK